MAPIGIEFEWLTPALVGLGIFSSMLIVLCPRKQRAQAAFEIASSPRPAADTAADTAPAEGTTEGM